MPMLDHKTNAMFAAVIPNNFPIAAGIIQKVK